jgi:hypothetical protein
LDAKKARSITSLAKVSKAIATLEAIKKSIECAAENGETSHLARFDDEDGTGDYLAEILRTEGFRVAGQLSDDGETYAMLVDWEDECL